MGVAAGPLIAGLGAAATSASVYYGFTVFIVNMVLSGARFEDEDGNLWIVSEDQGDERGRSAPESG